MPLTAASPILGGTYTPTGTNLSFNRLGYGAIQLTGPVAWGPPKDHAAALAIVREAVRCGVNHIDTSDYYGPHIANHIIKEAIHPYPDGLIIVTKVGARRGPDRSWPTALTRQELTSAVHDNLRHLGLEVLDVVNLRLGGQFGPDTNSVEAPLSVLAELKEQGLIRHIGLSNVSPTQIEEGRRMADIICVQNHYNLAHRTDDVLIDNLAIQGIAYVPFFPLGGFRPLTSPILDEVAGSLGATTRQVALAWLLRRSPNILLIAGTSSVEHLHQNFKAAILDLPPEAVERLDGIAATAKPER
ncbi:oxidoreductase [Nitrospirillum sp. BR 11163]|uniref:oxidoreductase n=1 Tax=Nitrospirillum sp. BR 11163 TaxID=3104323 RepID=UPI002AFF3A8F|nr:oxidoreductase [Nitrospirillum sp. BR 11163]MEA1672295.1 oxidoreductase [Nitrospirillum sp. BR 11163]